MPNTTTKPDLPDVRLRFGRFELDQADARLTCAGEPVALPPKPFDVLCALARTPGVLVTKNALLDAVWGHRFVSESVLKSAISEVRGASKTTPGTALIETASRAVIDSSPSRRSAAAVERKGAGHPAMQTHRIVPRRCALAD